MDLPTKFVGKAEEVFVGRQPIFKADFETFGYELLYRSSEENRAQFNDGKQATAELLLNTFAEIGLEQIVGKLPAFVNVAEDFILEDYCLALPKDRVVIEVLEDVRPTEDVVAKIKCLREKGYTIALDDFVLAPELMPLVEIANIVKVDLPMISPDELEQHVAVLRNYNLKLLAEKVETLEEFERCKSLGFDYYQGYLFCKPTIVKGKRVSSNRLSVIRLLAKLQQPTASLREVADLIKIEPGLAISVLRFVNSAYCGLSYEVESIEHAVTLVGLKQIKTICSLTTLLKASEDQPIEFIRTILVRAKMAELLATSLGSANIEMYFMTGLLSALDGILNVPMEEALEMVSVSSEMHSAIVNGEGELGSVLRCVIAYENGNWNEVSCWQLDSPTIRDSYLKAIEWVDNSLKSLIPR